MEYIIIIAFVVVGAIFKAVATGNAQNNYLAALQAVAKSPNDENLISQAVYWGRVYGRDTANSDGVMRYGEAAMMDDIRAAQRGVIRNFTV